MPLTSYATVLDPETMRAAQEAYDLAWAEIQKEPNGHDLEQARNLLAKRIIDAIGNDRVVFGHDQAILAAPDQPAAIGILTMVNDLGLDIEALRRSAG